MKKAWLLLTVIGLSFNVVLFAANSVANSNMLAILHPEQWGLDGLIKSLITIGFSYVIGLFTKKPNIQRLKFKSKSK